MGAETEGEAVSKPNRCGVSHKQLNALRGPIERHPIDPRLDEICRLVGSETITIEEGCELLKAFNEEKLGHCE